MKGDPTLVRTHKLACCTVHKCAFHDDECPVTLGFIVRDEVCEKCAKYLVERTTAHVLGRQLLSGRDSDVVVRGGPLDGIPVTGVFFDNLTNAVIITINEADLKATLVDVKKSEKEKK